MLALQLRTPMVVAMAGATLQALHPERDILLGVGISSPVVTERWHGVPYGDRPLARVREYVTLLRACLSGEKVDFAGDFYQVKGFRLGVRLGERRPKIVVGALNPAHAAPGRRGGRRGAAQLPARLARALVGRAGAQAGGDATVYAYVHAGVCERDEGIENARRDLYSYAVVDSYARNFERAGFGDEVAEIRGRFADGRPGGRGGGGQRPHGRRHRRHGRRRHRARHHAGLCRRRRRRAGAHAPALGRGPAGLGRGHHPRGRRGGLTSGDAHGAGLAVRAVPTMRGMELRDRICVVTGGASGIGQALCQRFAAEGARAVVVVDRDADGALATAGSIGDVRHAR